uniref:Transmembrane protein 134 n=1 Tax=Ailuropoda melanoleuca TaxID=9646 RepID=A0A7N5JE89_AILME
TSQASVSTSAVVRKSIPCRSAVSQGGDTVWSQESPWHSRRGLGCRRPHLGPGRLAPRPLQAHGTDPGIASEDGSRCGSRRRPLGGAAAPVRSPKEAPPPGRLGARQLGSAAGEQGRGRYVRAGPRPGRWTAALPKLRPGAGPACGGGTAARGAGGLGWRRRGAPERAGAMSAARPQFSIDDAFELSLEDAGPGPEFSGVARFGPLHFERRARFEVADEDKQSRLRYQPPLESPEPEPGSKSLKPNWKSHPAPPPILGTDLPTPPSPWAGELYGPDPDLAHTPEQTLEPSTPPFSVLEVPSPVGGPHSQEESLPMP